MRFVETTEAKIFRGDDLAKNSRTLSVNGKVENAASVGFDGGTVAANALKGRYVLVGGKRCKVVGNTASQLALDTAVTAADNDVIYPGEGGSQGCAVYGCLFLGKGAYGVVDLSEGTESHREAQGLLRHRRSPGPALQCGLEGHPCRRHSV
ncbi:MAG: hypothetical protein ACLR5H_07225 [Oscillospiraceae bacterium]